MPEELDELLKLYSAQKIIPFVGAGFSEACGCPSCEEIVEQLCNNRKLNQNDNYMESNADLPSIAEYLKILNGDDIGPIISDIIQIFERKQVNIQNSEPHLLLTKLNVPIIYTSNYDHLIESAFNVQQIPHNVVVTTADIIRTATSSATQIVKYHGSFDQIDSIVLTESDYFERLEFVTPLDIKLRADILGKGILFMGYSFTDYNIRYLWFKLRRMMNEVDEMDIPKSFILLTTTNNITDTLLQNVGIMPIYLNDFNGSSRTDKLCTFLKTILDPTIR